VGIRVVHVGTGTTGKEALRAIIRDPELDLVGLWVTTSEKEGRDAGALCAMPDVGIRGTTDVEAILALEPDCLSYGGNAVGREKEACADIARFLERGIDVVSFAIVSLVYPPASPPELRRVLEAACEKGGSTFYASGAEPGWLSMALPYTLLSVAGELTYYREEQHVLDMASVYPIREVVFGSMGFGQPAGSTPPRFVDGVCATWWVPNLHVIANALGRHVEATNFVWETHVTPHRLDTVLGPVERGTIGATYWELQGIIDGEPKITVAYVAKISHDAPVPDHWPLPASDTTESALVYRIGGRPTFTTQVYLGRQPNEDVSCSLALTARHVVNAIPTVVRAEPGLVTSTELAPYVTRDAFRDQPISQI